jgi:hypothetical protein
MDLLLRLAFFLMLICFPAAAIAQEPGRDSSTEIGTGIVCDSAQQIERYVALKAEGARPDQAIQLVNAEAKSPHACGLVVVAFIPGAEVGNLSVTGGTLRVIEIIIVAAATHAGWNSVPATTQYTAVFVRSEQV